MSGVVWELIPWNEDKKVIVLFVCVGGIRVIQIPRQ